MIQIVVKISFRQPQYFVPLNGPQTTAANLSVGRRRLSPELIKRL